MGGEEVTAEQAEDTPRALLLPPGSGLADAAGTFVQNLGGTIASGLAGVAATPFVGADRAANITRGIQKAVIREPFSESGRRTSALLAKPVEFVAEGVNRLCRTFWLTCADGFLGYWRCFGRD